jgi:poly(A) polymerase
VTPKHDPAEQREAALVVVDGLRAGGHEAYFVGGCVRDELLGRTPREYDIATDAEPDRVQQLFPRNVAVGKRFGVIVCLVGEIPVEVATFRSDDAYVDGRRPTSVRFSSAREDAERRDFTMNALYFDPVSGQTLDFVGGKADLESRVLRAIGDPRERFREDKLRLLRAVRFAATVPAEPDPETWAAVKEMAAGIEQVSWERIREEISRILVSGHAERGFVLLKETGLLPHILPELDALAGVEQPPEFHPEGDVWVHTLLCLRHLDALPDPPLPLALGILLHDIGKPATFRVADRIRFDGHDRVGADMSEEVLQRLRYPNAVIAEVKELVRRHMAFTQIQQWRPAKLKRFLTGELGERHLDLHRLDCLGAHGMLDTHDWCRERREELLNEPPPPPRIVTGRDLLAAGYPHGRQIGKVLAAIEDEHLEGKLGSKEEALAWALEQHPPTEDAR